MADTEQVNFSNIARETGVSSPTVKTYYEILQDTLLGRWLPAYQRRPKRRIATAPKFYFADVGIVNHLARRGKLEPKSELYGKAFENWIHHELTAYNAYSESFANLSHWRLTSGAEVDFIVNDMAVAIDAKATARVTDQHLRGLRVLTEDYPVVGGKIIVSLESKARRTNDGILVLPVSEFVNQLWDGKLF